MATAREELIEALGRARVGDEEEGKERQKHKRSNEMPHLGHIGPSGAPLPRL